MKERDQLQSWARDLCLFFAIKLFFFAWCFFLDEGRKKAEQQGRNLFAACLPALLQSSLAELCQIKNQAKDWSRDDIAGECTQYEYC
jgi:hypothetical protein